MKFARWVARSLLPQEAFGHVEDIVDTAPRWVEQRITRDPAGMQGVAGLYNRSPDFGPLCIVSSRTPHIHKCVETRLNLGSDFQQDICIT